MSTAGRHDLQDAAAAVRRALDDPPRTVEAVYAALGELDELTMVLAAYVRRLSSSVRSLPGIVDGLRIDDLDDPVEPGRVRDNAAENLSLACASIDLAQTGIAAAHQLAGRLYLEP